MEFRKHTLDNGLQIIAECSDKAYSMAMGFFVNTGSRDEVAEVAGVSHFLEHMVFKGTPTRSAAEVNRELDEIGSQSNAYTSEEHTVYYAAVLPDYQEQVLDLLSDIMRPSLRKEDFDTEKKVILEEIQKYDDQPPYGAHEKCMAAYFGEHPLGQSVLGTLDSVGALKRDAMMDYFERRYSPGNMTLVASGNVDFDALIKAAEQRCGKWQQYEVTRDTRRAAGSNDIVHYIEQPASSLEYVIQISGGPDADDESRYARRLMSVIFGDEGGSRLFWDLV
ncbi:MAG: pitrilysin family protein, partial [Planctomycetota bacterium]